MRAAHSTCKRREKRCLIPGGETKDGSQIRDEKSYKYKGDEPHPNIQSEGKKRDTINYGIL